MKKISKCRLKINIKSNKIPLVVCEALRFDIFVLGAMAAETTRVGVVAILLSDAPQPIKKFLLNTDESRIKNEKRRKRLLFIFPRAFFSAFHSFNNRTQKNPPEQLFVLLVFLLLTKFIFINNQFLHL